MALVDLLQDIADGLQIVRGGNTGIELAEPIAFGLTPPLPSSLDTLQLGDVNALAFTKDVRFTDALSPTGPLATYLTSATNIAGGQPVVDPTMTANLPLPVALGNTLTLPTLSGPSSPSAGNLLSGTPGLIGQISGTLPIPIQVPVTARVTWTIEKPDGPAVEGTDYLAPNGLVGPNLVLLFLPQFSELTTSFVSSLVRFNVSASVQVQAFGVSTPPTEVGPIPIDVPALVGLPTVAAMFRHRDYAIEDSTATEGSRGAVVIAVPGDSGVATADQLFPVLNSLQALLTKLQSLRNDVLSGNLLTFLLGLNTLIGALNSQPNFQYTVGNVTNLENVRYSTSGWSVFPPAAPGSDLANDETSSFIMLGVAGNRIQMFGNSEFEGAASPHPVAMTVTLGAALWVTIRSFHFTNNTDVVVFPPSNVVTIDNNGSGGDFNDKISSYRFSRV